MKRTFLERISAVLLAALMVCTMIPFAVSADDNVLDGTDSITLTSDDVLEDTVEPDAAEDVIDDIAKSDVTEDAPDEFPQEEAPETEAPAEEISEEPPTEAPTEEQPESEPEADIAAYSATTCINGGSHHYTRLKKNTDIHWYECEACGYKLTSSHTFVNNECVICGFETGHDCAEHQVFYPHTINSAWIVMNDENHLAYCSICSNPYNRLLGEVTHYYPHTYNEDGYCTVCNYKNHEHTLKYITYDKLQHYAACKDCGYLFLENHNYDSKGTCTSCGETATWACKHQFKVTGTGSLGHTLTCTICGGSDYEEHDYKNGTCICGRIKHNCYEHLTAYRIKNSEQHENICSICGEFVYPAVASDHTFGKDGKCTACGMEEHDCREHEVVDNQKKLEGKYDDSCWADGHFSKCEICGEQISYDNISYLNPHTMKNGVCTVCGFANHTHTFEYCCKTDSDRIYASDQGHYKYCTTCGVLILVGHTFDYNGECFDCQYSLGHHYVYNAETCEQTAEYHETRCTLCEKSKGYSAHTFGTDGKCTVCGYSENITPSIPDGLNKVDGVWKYYKDGEVDTSYTGAVRYNGGIFYVTNGIMDTNYAGLVKFENAWLYISGGRFNGAFNGAIRYNGGIFYVTNGVMNWSYTGLTKFENAWIYVKNSRFDGTFTNAIRYNGGIFYITKGVLNWSYTGLTKFENAWIYITKSKFDGAFNGLVSYNGGLFYITKGVLNWSYTGMAKYNNTWYYIVNSKRSFYNGTVNQNGVTYTVKNGIATSWK